MIYIVLAFTLTAVSFGFLTGRLKRKDIASQRFSVGTHVVVSGGSKGIGKSIAKKFAELGTHVTIIARNEDDLKAARSEIEKHRKKDVQQVRAVSLDLTKLTDSNGDSSKQEFLDKLLGEHERCDILINCCGTATPAKFEDLSESQFRYMMEVNYFSAVNLTKLLLPVMKARSSSNQNGSRTHGNRLVFVSSICGLMSFYGYSGYSASKFALVGLAQALNMELRPFDIGVTIAFPPDTDTPGYEEENKSKPLLTLKMSEAGNLYTPDEVAQSIIDDMRAKKFCSTIGLENQLVVSSMNSFMPTSSIVSTIGHSFLAGPLKIVAYFVLRTWYKMVDEENKRNA